MPDRISSHPFISPIERPDNQPAHNHVAAPDRQPARPSRTLEAGTQHGPGSTSALHRRTHGTPVSALLRRTSSRSDLTDRVAAFSRRFQEDQDAPPVPRVTSLLGRDAAERPAQTSPAAHVEQTAPNGGHGVARQPQNSAGTAQPYRYPYPAPHFGPYLAPAYAPYSCMPQSHWSPHLAAPYYTPYHWSAQHTYPAGSPVFSPQGYTAYTRPRPWQPLLPDWLAPSCQSRVVGANSRIGFTYGFGDGPNGKQMHVGFHFNGRFHTLHFGLYPSATRPFFVQSHRGYMQAAPTWLPAAPWHGSVHAYEPAAVSGHAGATAAHRPWHAVLEIPEDRATLELVTLRYRLKKRRLEANGAGSRPAILELQAAYESALQALSARARG
ncbi:MULTISPECIES: hypothetical protein [unclassified Burkholderia]|uniref:hypothetical protein n=1 Tax=unclassified Burkholderia TaxID=2613784 RepID=UPI00215004ED|nr:MULTISPECIES: hypothetical protein [unclassified Burkholderia]MCR4469749.1 hypothetical protein [Burkholderia sp. SCN-KJ]